MTKKVSCYREQLQNTLDIFCPELAVRHVLTFKNCFGAVSGYIEGNIFCSYGKFGFALKLQKTDIEALFKVGGQPLRYFVKGHIKKDYAVTPEAIWGEKEKMKVLIKKSAKFSTESKGV